MIPNKRLGKRLVRVLSEKRLKRVSRIIVPSCKMEDTLIDYGLCNMICVVPSGICLKQHKKRIPEEERKEKRKVLGITDGDSVLINLGRLGTEKNLEELLVLFSKALIYNDNLIFLIVGDGPAKMQLEKLSENLGISDRVIFTGMVEPSEVQEYYQLGDVFVSASTSETQGLTYIEAAANGLPLLCRKDLCLKDVIKQGENGYEYSNEEEFLNDINAIIKNPEWRVVAGQRSEKMAEAFDKSKFGSAVEKVYKSVICQ